MKEVNLVVPHAGDQSATVTQHGDHVAQQLLLHPRPQGFQRGENSDFLNSLDSLNSL